MPGMLMHIVVGACRFQRSVLRKGQLLKRGKAGALFGDRYAVSSAGERWWAKCSSEPDARAIGSLVLLITVGGGCVARESPKEAKQMHLNHQ